MLSMVKGAEDLEINNRDYVLYRDVTAIEQLAQPKHSQPVIAVSLTIPCKYIQFTSIKISEITASS